MASVLDKLQQALKNPFEARVYYFASQEQAMLRQAAKMTRQALLGLEGQQDDVRIEGPAPDMGEVIASAGARSFFGTRRVVELWEIQPSTMNEGDIDELASLFFEVESAVLIVTVVYKDKKAAAGKKAKKLFEAAAKAGFALELQKPTRAENINYLAREAATLGTEFAPGAAQALLARAGDDRDLLSNEVAKLAAICNYQIITVQNVEANGVHNIEADVFALARHITAGQTGAAFSKLEELLALRHEPTMITAALAGVFVDMYRVRCGAETKHPVGVVFKDMGYTGGDYRLQKAKENAARYTTAALESSVLCLARLDISLKSGALSDKSVLLEAALSQLLQLRQSR